MGATETALALGGIAAVAFLGSPVLAVAAVVIVGSIAIEQIGEVVKEDVYPEG